MHHRYLITLLLVSTLLIGLTPRGQAQETNDAVTANNSFALDFYRQITTLEDGNIIFSPYSIQQAFGMAYAGAEADTEQQIGDAMRFGMEQETLHPALSALNDNLLNRPMESFEGDEKTPPTFRLANRFYAQQDFPFRQSYFDTLTTHYDGGMELVDFMADPEAVRQAINAWVAEQTNDKIQNLMPPNSVNTDTRLVLANAIYFLGSWWMAFPEYGTRDAPFYLPDGTTVEVPMMVNEGGYAYTVGEDYVAVSLPYYQSELALLALLPDDVDAFAAGLDAASFADIVGSLEFSQLALHFPRFEFQTSLDLIDTLRQMGMEAPFDPDAANFNGMAEDANLFIGAAVHKAYISVDENGTEAAAATGLSVGVTSAPPPGEPVVFDRPFLYFIYDGQTGTILFMGRVLNPAA